MKVIRAASEEELKTKVDEALKEKGWELYEGRYREGESVCQKLRFQIEPEAFLL